MFGNTLFFAGSKVFVDPTFLLSAPDARRDEVVQFGVGGIYNVNKVYHSIEPGSFSTKISVTLLYSMDGRDQNAAGSAKQKDTTSQAVQDRSAQIKQIEERKPPIDGK